MAAGSTTANWAARRGAWRASCSTPACSAASCCRCCCRAGRPCWWRCSARHAPVPASCRSTPSGRPSACRRCCASSTPDSGWARRTWPRCIRAAWCPTPRSPAPATPSCRPSRPSRTPPTRSSPAARPGFPSWWPCRTARWRGASPGWRGSGTWGPPTAACKAHRPASIRPSSSCCCRSPWAPAWPCRPPAGWPRSSSPPSPRATAAASQPWCPPPWPGCSTGSRRSARPSADGCACAWPAAAARC